MTTEENIVHIALLALLVSNELDNHKKTFQAKSQRHKTAINNLKILCENTENLVYKFSETPEDFHELSLLVDKHLAGANYKVKLSTYLACMGKLFKNG